MKMKCQGHFLAIGLIAVVALLMGGGCSSIPQKISAKETVGHRMGKSFLNSPIVQEYLKDHKTLKVEFLRLNNYSPRVIRVMGILKGDFDQVLERSPGVIVVAGSGESRSLASEERYYQMRHARSSEIHAPGRQHGADIAILGSVGCSTVIGDRVVRIFLYTLKGIDLSDNSVVWNHTVEVSVNLTKKLTMFQKTQEFRSLQFYGDPCR